MDCFFCNKHKTGYCDECGKVIPSYPEMGKNGYQSARPSHMHPASVLGVMGERAVFRELCLECYRKDYEVIYPETAVPV